MMCEGCTADEHWRCGMQTWCACECDGSTDWAIHEIDPDAGLTLVEDGADDDDLPAHGGVQRCGYCNKQIVQAVCGSGYVHVETGLTACIVAHPSDPPSPKATRLSHDVRRCSAQACCRIEGHNGNDWCSVCNVRDLAGVAYDEHECYPSEKVLENQ